MNCSVEDLVNSFKEIKFIFVTNAQFFGMVSINDYIYIDLSCFIMKNNFAKLVGTILHENGHREPRK